MSQTSHDAFAPTLAAIADAAVSKFTGVKFVTSSDNYLHVRPATQGVCHGIAQTDCAAGQEVTVKLFCPGLSVLADASTAIGVGDPLVITGTSATKMGAQGTAFDGIAIEALASGTGVIEFLPINAVETAGAQGAQGSQGAQGHQGSQGTQGTQGPQGG